MDLRLLLPADPVTKVPHGLPLDRKLSLDPPRPSHDNINPGNFRGVRERENANFHRGRRDRARSEVFVDIDEDDEDEPDQSQDPNGYYVRRRRNNRGRYRRGRGRGRYFDPNYYGTMKTKRERRSED